MAQQVQEEREGQRTEVQEQEAEEVPQEELNKDHQIFEVIN
jgi:hypothetical protein